jgi:hypothetical protein
MRIPACRLQRALQLAHAPSPSVKGSGGQGRVGREERFPLAPAPALLAATWSRHFSRLRRHFFLSCRYC